MVARRARVSNYWRWTLDQERNISRPLRPRIEQDAHARSHRHSPDERRRHRDRNLDGTAWIYASVRTGARAPSPHPGSADEHPLFFAAYRRDCAVGDYARPLL